MAKKKTPRKKVSKPKRRPKRVISTHYDEAKEFYRNIRELNEIAGKLNQGQDIRGSLADWTLRAFGVKKDEKVTNDFKGASDREIVNNLKTNFDNYETKFKKHGKDYLNDIIRNTPLDNDTLIERVLPGYEPRKKSRFKDSIVKAHKRIHSMSYVLSQIQEAQENEDNERANAYIDAIKDKIVDKYEKKYKSKNEDVFNALKVLIENSEAKTVLEGFYSHRLREARDNLKKELEKKDVKNYMVATVPTDDEGRDSYLRELINVDYIEERREKAMKDAKKKVVL